MQDRELVSDPTNRSARNGQNTKGTNGARTLTSARGWHGAFTPAHEVSQNRPKQSGLSIDIFIYNRVDYRKRENPFMPEAIPDGHSADRQVRVATRRSH